MSSIVYEPLKLMRKDGKIVDAVYYNNADIENVEILNIKELKFEGKAVKDIKKADIHNACNVTHEMISCNTWFDYLGQKVS